MERQEIFNIVRKVVAKSMSLDAKETAALNETTALAKDLGADSADNLCFMLDIEKAFKINPTMSTKDRRATFRGFKSIGDLCDYAAQKFVAVNV